MAVQSISKQLRPSGDVANKPLDVRTEVSNYSELLELTGAYVGMHVYVKNNYTDGNEVVHPKGEYIVTGIDTYGDVTTVESVEESLGIPTIEAALGGKQDTISDLSQIREGAGKGATALQPVSGATPNNFASFDANGGIKDSNCNEGTFIKGVQQNGVDLMKDANGKVNITVQGGESAYDLYVDSLPDGATPLSLEAWLASLKAHIGEFMFVPTDATAVTAMATIGQTYQSAIDPNGKNVAPTQDTLSVILLMNDDATTPTKTMMIATQKTAMAGTYEFVYAGDLQSAMPSNVLTEDDVDNTHLENPSANSVAKASDVKAEIDKINDDIMNVVETKTPIVEDGFYSGRYIDGNGKIQNSSGLVCYYKQITALTEIYYVIYNTAFSTQNIRIAVYDDDISNIPGSDHPQGTVIAGKDPTSGIATIQGGKWLAWVYKDDTHKADVYDYSKTYDGYKPILSEGEVETIATEIAEEVSSPFGIGISSNERAIELRQLADKTSSIVVDWMKVCHAKEGLNYTGLMNVIESSENSITLSTTDAAHFIGNENGHCAVCVRFSDGLVKVVYFDSYSGNDGVVNRSVYDNTDLTDAVNVQSLHDTIKQGYGIHLSQLGYIMLGQFTAQEIMKVENQRDTNLVKGVCFNNLTTDEYHPYLDNGKLYSKFGEYICDVAATTAIGISTTAGILGDWYLNRCMTLRSAIASGNGTLTIPLSARGYFMISCMSKNTTIYSSVPLKMKLYIDGSDTPSQTFDVPVNAVQFYTSNYIDVRKELKIVFDSNDTDSFVAAIADFGFIRISPDIKAPIICTETINIPQTLIQRQTTIAVLGDSWTQFPHITDGLAEYSDYNEKVTSPDITEPSQNYHDGFGYFPKELAFRLGAAVDNYGKSGMRSDNWGVIKIDEILSIKHYDYLVVEFFINDTIQKLKPNQWAYNIWLICQKCKAAGTRPIIILACEDNGIGFVSYGNRRAQFLYGLGNATFIE